MSSAPSLRVQPDVGFSQRFAVRYQLVQDSLDIWLPMGSLNFHNLDDGVLGLIGCVASRCRVRANAPQIHVVPHGAAQPGHEGARRQVEGALFESLFDLPPFVDAVQLVPPNLLSFPCQIAKLDFVERGDAPLSATSSSMLFGGSRALSLLLSLAALATAAAAATPTVCNGHAEFCSRSYSNVSVVGAHDSYSVGAGNSTSLRPSR